MVCLISIYLSQDLAGGSISSEDLEVTLNSVSPPRTPHKLPPSSPPPPPPLSQMAASMGQLTVLLPQVLTNPLQQTGNRAAGLIDTGRQEAPPTVASPSGVEPQTSGGGAPQPNNNRIPAGLELATREVPTVRAAARPTRSTAA